MDTIQNNCEHRIYLLRNDYVKLRLITFEIVNEDFKLLKFRRCVAWPKREMTQSIFNTNHSGHKTHGYDKFPGCA